jgi:lysine 2,3-aminomutase
MVSSSDSRVIVRNYEGFISAYVQPETYTPHDRASCRHCQEQARPLGGVAGLLAGQQSSIAPEGWHSYHEHR